MSYDTFGDLWYPAVHVLCAMWPVWLIVVGDEVIKRMARRTER